jgi:hypothetical protein
MRTLAAILTLLFLGLLQASAQDGRLIPNPVRNIPAWVRNEFAAKHLDEQYAITYTMYPYTFKGDFNGDERRDVVIQIVEKRSGKAGIAIFHAKRPQALYTNVAILGANTWNVIPLRKLPTSGVKGVIDAEGDVIILEHRGSTKGAICWDGKRYISQRLKR